MRKSAFPIYLAILAVIMVSLACNLNKETEPEPEKKDSTGCTATHVLRLTGEITKNTMNELGTRLCDYKIKITNIHPSATVWPVIYHHHEDGYQNIDESEWVVLTKIGPGESVEWFGNVYTYTDPDATGPVMNTVDEITGIIDSQDCASFRSDNDYLEKFADKVASVCLLE